MNDTKPLTLATPMTWTLTFTIDLPYLRERGLAATFRTAEIVAGSADEACEIGRFEYGWTVWTVVRAG